MKFVQANRLASLRHAEHFFANNADRLPQVAATGARRRLSEIVVELNEFVAEQAGSTIEALGATRRLHAVRRLLVEDHMAPIVSIARVELGSIPQLSALRLPRGTPASGKLAAAAKGMAEEAAAHADVFIQAGLPHDFIARLFAAADAVIDAEIWRKQCRGRVTGATTALRHRLAAGRRVVNVLDNFVRSATREDPALLTKWRSVRAIHGRTGRPSHRSTGEETPTPVPHGAEMAIADHE